MAEQSGDQRKRFDEVDSTGTNSRPRHDTISQTGGGVPDDTGGPVDLDPEEEKRIADSIRNMPGGKEA
jgi:hypothetical protein